MSPILLDPTALALASLLVLANAAASLALRLGLGRKLVTAAARAVLQLLLLGYVLVLVFESDSPWIVVGLMFAMAFIAGIEAVRRTTRRVPGIYRSSLGVVIVSSMARSGRWSERSGQVASIQARLLRPTSQSGESRTASSRATMASA